MTKVEQKYLLYSLKVQKSTLFVVKINKKEGAFSLF